VPDDKEKLILDYVKTRQKTLIDPIIVAYTPLVEYIARRLAFQKEDVQDLVQVGSIGLLKSLENFLPEKNVTFSTFASSNVIGEMRHYLRDKVRIVRVPRKIHDNYSKISKFIKQYIQEHNGEYPTVKTIADSVDLPEDFIIESLEAIEATKIVSLDKPLYEDGSSGDQKTLKDSLGVDMPIDQLLDSDAIQEAMAQLTDRKRQIIRYRFYDGFTQSEISKKLNCSQMHISRLINDALSDLKKLLNEGYNTEET